MPELPEVETTRAGIAPYSVGRSLHGIDIWETRLRWPVPAELAECLQGATLLGLRRRAKYLLFDWDVGLMIVHLGMSGSLRLVNPTTPRKTHDHLQFLFAEDRVLRYHDPRRFGCVLWHGQNNTPHPLLAELGPEPLGPEFAGDYLHQRAAGRKVSVKHFIMDQATVVGVGNIYANEALFRAGIHPARAAGRVSRERYDHLAMAIREVLAAAITQGGTTLRDFVNGQGEPGYFAQSLAVYERAGLACVRCGEPIKQMRIGQRSSYYCGKCQR